MDRIIYRFDATAAATTTTSGQSLLLTSSRNQLAIIFELSHRYHRRDQGERNRNGLRCKFIKTFGA